MVNNDNDHSQNMRQPGLGVLGASLSLQAYLVKAQSKWPSILPLSGILPLSSTQPLSSLPPPRSILPLPSCFQGIPVALPKAHHAIID